MSRHCRKREKGESLKNSKPAMPHP